MTLPSRAPERKPVPFGSQARAVTVSECSVSVSRHTPDWHLEREKVEIQKKVN